MLMIRSKYFKGWRGGCSIALIAIGLALIPFKTTMVPRWRIQVVDEKGAPYQGKLVRQFCDDYTLRVDPCRMHADSMQLTDENGYVDFPERTFWLSALSRLLRNGYSILLLIAHGSRGSDIAVDSSGPMGYKRVEYDGDGPLPDKIVLPRE